MATPIRRRLTLSGYPWQNTEREQPNDELKGLCNGNDRNAARADGPTPEGPLAGRADVCAHGAPDVFRSSRSTVGGRATLVRVCGFAEPVRRGSSREGFGLWRLCPQTISYLQHWCSLPSRQADAVLLGEAEGREVALRLGLPVSGTVGVLEKAAERDLLDLPDAFRRLSRTSIRLSPELLQQALLRDAARHPRQEQERGR